MLTSSNLVEDDEVSSFGTMVPPSAGSGDHDRTGSATDDDDDDDDEEHEEWLTRDSEEWRVVGTDGLDTHSLDGEQDAASGLLILDGEEEAEAEEKMITSVFATEKKGNHDNNNNNNRSSKSDWGSSLDFSVPGADSVPTIVGSIDGLPATVAGSTPTTIIASDEKKKKKDPTKSDPSDNGTQDDQHEQDLVPSISSKGRLALLFVPTVVLFLVPTIASIRFYQEKNALLASVVKLEGEITRLQEEAKKQKKRERLWETCGNDDSKDTVLVDNCWLTAKANIELGDCASHAKDNILKLSASLSERLALLGHQSWMDPFASFDYDDQTNDNYNYDDEDSTETLSLKMKQSLGKAREAQVERMRFLGAALWNATKGKADGVGDPRSHGDNYSFFTKTESNSESQWKNTLQDA